MDDDELDRRLGRLDRMAGVRIPEPVLDRTHVAAREASARGPRRRFSLVAGITVFALGAAVAAPTMADTVGRWLATSGWQPAPENEFIPGSETVDLTAEDLPAYIESLYPDWLPLAPGTSEQELIDQVVEVWTTLPDPQQYAQEVGIRYSFEQYAVCGWIEIAGASEDPVEVGNAREVMHDALTWPAISAYEAKLGDESDTSEYLAAAVSGDAQALSEAAWALACPGAPRP